MVDDMTVKRVESRRPLNSGSVNRYVENNRRKKLLFGGGFNFTPGVLNSLPNALAGNGSQSSITTAATPL